MIKVEGICKAYGNVQALNDVCFSTGRGELFGIIGPDGAGKTSLFRILTTLLLADKGTAYINGLHVARDSRLIRSCIGYMPGRFSLYPDLTVEENLRFFATLFGASIKKNYPLIEAIYSQIAPFSSRKAGKLSGGMKQKLALSCALIHEPTVLFLDEPTTGVDPVSRKEFWGMLHVLKSKGMSVLVSTPYMDEAAQCDRIALMQQGSILAVDSPAAIISSYPRALYAVSSDSNYRLLTRLRNDPNVFSAYIFGESLHVSFRSNAPDLSAYDNITVRQITPCVEDCFIELLTP